MDRAPSADEPGAGSALTVGGCPLIVFPDTALCREETGSAGGAVHRRKGSSDLWREDVNHMKTIYLAGGCFWGVQRFIDQFDGVIETETGYANGPTENPLYRDVCQNSGHAETVRVVYDEDILSLKQLLEYFFMVIDPLSVNRQGGDSGIQYRTGIYYTDESQLPGIREVFDAQQAKYASPLAVEVKPLENFYPAEEYHQKYLCKNPDGYCHIPKPFFSLSKKD